MAVKVKIVIKLTSMSMVSDYAPDSLSGKVLACSSSVWLMGEGMEGMGTKPSRQRHSKVVPAFYLLPCMHRKYISKSHCFALFYWMPRFTGGVSNGLQLDISHGGVWKSLLGMCETKAWSIGRKIGGREEVGER